VGGQVATAVVTCSTLGLRAKYIGTVGDDLRGGLQLDSLRAAGIDIQHVQQRRNCPNQSAYIVVDQSTGERTIFWNRPECLAISPSDISSSQITCARLLHIDGHDTAAVEHAAGIARAHGIPVTCDVDTIYPGFERVLPLVDYLIGSAEFPARWTGFHDPFDALLAIHRSNGMRVAAMTLGANGVLAYAEGQFHYAAAFQVNCVDTTGAGDVFHGAFCYSVLQQMPIAEALEFSNAMAALNCTAPGARGHIATKEEAFRFMHSAAVAPGDAAILSRLQAR
jgi:sulfofructose kinase